MKRTLLAFAGGLLALISVTVPAQTGPTERLVKQYSTLAGDDTGKLVAALRGGTKVTLHEGQADSATLTPPTGKMGYGNVNIALALAEADLKKQGTLNPTPQQLVNSLDSLLKERASGRGWGEIANSMGVKLGEVMRSERAAARHEERERNAHAERHARAERPERPEKPQRPERPERPERPGR